MRYSSKGIGRRSIACACVWAAAHPTPSTIIYIDAWWVKLGSRLRDLPGREFPQLPERIAQTLQRLWNEALDGARETLQAALLAREQVLAQREHTLEERTRQLADSEHATGARMSALAESVSLAREQLDGPLQRAEALEGTVQERDRECHRLRARIESLEADCAEWRMKLDAAAAAHHGERVQLQERYAAAANHWLLEVDRARQQAKQAAKEHEQQTKELRRRIEALQSEREQLRQDVLEARAECKTMVAVREQLQERLRAASQATDPASRPSARAKARGPNKPSHQPRPRARGTRARHTGAAK
jgi:chromosome segregation ATPase